MISGSLLFFDFIKCRIDSCERWKKPFHFTWNRADGKRTACTKMQTANAVEDVLKFETFYYLLSFYLFIIEDKLGSIRGIEFILVSFVISSNQNRRFFFSSSFSFSAHSILRRRQTKRRKYLFEWRRRTRTLSDYFNLYSVSHCLLSEWALFSFACLIVVPNCLINQFSFVNS